ncbi:MAG: CDP-alcohol phosphatidyltransferase family protein [Deltaproteobacteria bacterium]|nr:MAG: CDP-alcohol phosphatidyltransferase family protein [Deltaproteobacteria bacterium]
MTAPIREAFVVAEPGDPPRSVAGVPLLVRTILVLERAGIERLTVIGAVPPADPRIHVRLGAAPAVRAAADGMLRLVVGPGAVIDAALVHDLQARAPAGRVLELEHQGARVRVAPGALVATTDGTPAAPRAGVLLPATAPAPVLERALLRGLENPRDGRLDRLLHRRLSRPLTRLLLRTPLSPNAVTLLGIALGVAGGVALGAPTLGGIVAGLACLIASGVLDCSDGELARLRFAESRLGHWLDMAGDTVVHLAVLGGLARRLLGGPGLPRGPVLALLGIGVLASFAVISWSEHAESRRHRAGGWENRVLDGVLAPLSTRDWYFLVVPFVLAGRLDWLVLGAAIGSQVFWVAALVLLVRALGRVRSL